MGEYEPRDSRNVTLKDGHAPGEPPRTGPREGKSRAPERTEKDDPPRGQTEPAAEEKAQESWRDSERR